MIYITAPRGSTAYGVSQSTFRARRDVTESCSRRPASYGASGIRTFIVNQDGIVFQRDLGPNTAKVAAATKRFDPDLSWARVDAVN